MIGIDVARVVNGWLLTDHSDNSKQYVFVSRENLMAWIDARAIQLETPAA